MLWRCWLGGRKGIRPVKNWVVMYWRGYLSGARCKRFAYDPADATATPSSLAAVKSIMVYLSGAGLPLALVFSERELTFALCCHPSVCRLSRWLIMCLVGRWTLLNQPTKPVEIFGNISQPFGTLAIRWLPRKVLRRSSQGNPSVMVVLNARGVAK